MIDTTGLFERLSLGRGSNFEFDDDPTKADLQAVVRELKAEGLCGRRIGEQRLGPYFIASERHGQRELDLLEAVIDEEYEDLNVCVRTRSSECSRLRGGCKGQK